MVALSRTQLEWSRSFKFGHKPDSKQIVNSWIQHTTKLVLKRLIQHFFYKSLFQSIFSMHFQRIVEFNKIWKKKIISSIWNGSDESVFFKRLLIILLIFKWGCFRSFWFVLDNFRSFLEQKKDPKNPPPPPAGIGDYVKSSKLPGCLGSKLITAIFHHI